MSNAVTDIYFNQANDGTFDIEFDKTNQTVQYVSGYETAFLGCLFVDRRTVSNEGVADPRQRGGYLGDILTKQNNIELGSKLFLKQMSRNTPNDINEVQAYANEGLAYLSNSGYAKQVQTNVIGSNLQGMIVIDANKSNTYSAIWALTGSVQP